MTHDVGLLRNDGVIPGVPFIPEVFFEESFYPICGHWFWNNNVGAGLVCEALGFHFGGTVHMTHDRYSRDAMPVGHCNDADVSLTSCSGGGNAFGELDYNGEWCSKGNFIGVKVVCTPDPAAGLFCTYADSESCMCSNSCADADDNVCEDGGRGSEFDLCEFGTGRSSMISLTPLLFKCLRISHYLYFQFVVTALFPCKTATTVGNETAVLTRFESWVSYTVVVFH